MTTVIALFAVGAIVGLVAVEVSTGESSRVELFLWRCAAGLPALSALYYATQQGWAPWWMLILFAALQPAWYRRWIIASAHRHHKATAAP